MTASVAPLIARQLCASNKWNYNMGKLSEETLSNWTKPPSDSEETKLSNSERMVKEALDANETTSKLSFEVFGQGSYANDTNVRLNSDIDINVRYTGGFYFDLPPDTTEADVGIAELPGAAITFSEYKNYIALLSSLSI